MACTVFLYPSEQKLAILEEKNSILNCLHTFKYNVIPELGLKAKFMYMVM
jgi:hypothetical protein